MKNINKEQEKLREEIQPFLDVLYDEYSQHKTCHYEFGCVIESITLWRKFHKIIKQINKL